MTPDDDEPLTTAEDTAGAALVAIIAVLVFVGLNLVMFLEDK